MEETMEKIRREGHKPLSIAGLETVMEGADMRALVLTLAPGECVPWHYHSNTTEEFFCLAGPLVVETRGLRAEYHTLHSGERCTIPPKVPHCVHGKNNGPCCFLLIQGLGIYDYVPVGGKIPCGPAA